jgi:diguanylate cyclase (GGDEF)-like protein
MTKLEPGRPLYVSMLVAEVVRLRRENARLAALAYRDELTGLRNRRHFSERLPEEVSRVRRHGGALSVILIDVNDFKPLNDSWGHAAGDEALVRIARLLMNSTRIEDVCCRLGGDEFAVLLPDTGETHCDAMVERMREQMLSLEDVGLGRNGIAIGTATWRPEDEKDSFLRRADEAMYADKRRIKNGSASSTSVALASASASAA